MKFKCINCENKTEFPKKYFNGKGLKEKQYTLIKVNCNKCYTQHEFSCKFKTSEPNNILGYLINYEGEKKLKLKNAFWFEETNNPFTLSGYITNCYLLLGFDEDQKLRKKINNIENQWDKKILEACFTIVKAARNGITQHNKNQNLSKLKEEDIYPLFINAINTMVMILNKYGYMPFKVEDRRIESRKVKFI